MWAMQGVGNLTLRLQTLMVKSHWCCFVCYRCKSYGLIEAIVVIYCIHEFSKHTVVSILVQKGLFHNQSHLIIMYG